MRCLSIAGTLLLPVALLTACSGPPKQAVESTAPTPAPQTEAPRPAARPVPATVTVEYQYDQSWRPVTALDAHMEPGPAVIRLSFSKPVKRAEVEAVLVQAQTAPVRGAMQWDDDRTLVWLVTQMPPRIDFLLGGAHDADGLPLPGGIPSLRTGAPPALVTADLAAGKDQQVAPLPPDIVAAAMSSDHKYLNVTAWSPGTTRWDWQTVDLSLALDGLQLKSGRAGDAASRLPVDLESWAINPGGTLVAGLRPAGRTDAAGQGLKDLVISDARGGRQRVIPGFATRAGAPGPGGIVWSADGSRIATATDSSTGAGKSDLVLFELESGKRSIVTRDLPVPANLAHMAWSADGRYLVAGTVLADLQQGTHRVLPGDPAQVRGLWEPGGARLVYSTRDWAEILLVDPAAAGAPKSLGAGLLADWAGPGRIYLVRWPAANTRYVPPGQ